MIWANENGFSNHAGTLNTTNPNIPSKAMNLGNPWLDGRVNDRRESRMIPSELIKKMIALAINYPIAYRMHSFSRR